MNGARVLIVEDEGILAMTLEKKLARLGYSTLQPVSTGQEAVFTVKNEQPEIVLMDINLSGDMDGITAAGHIQSFSDVPIVYLTCHSDEPLLERAKQTQPYGYLIKPVSIQDLKACLEIAIHQYTLDKKLEESEKRYRSIVENINDAIIIHDFNGRIMDVNENACQMLGYERNELIGSGISLFLRPEKLVSHEKHLSTLQSESGIVFEEEYARRDGALVPVEVSSKVVSRESGGVIQAFARDISERKGHEKQIKEKNEQLRKALAERDKFFSIIAHDLRSPLVAFLMFIRMLTDKTEKMSLEQIERLSLEMLSSAKNLYSLLENLLEWSLVQRGAKNYKLVTCRLADLVKENIDLIQPSATHKNIAFKCRIPEDLKVLADKSMLMTILRNLLSNALKFSKKDGEVEVSARPEGSRVLIRVKDHGLGMDEKLISGLFMPDRMSSRKGTAQEKGTGLGLILCKEFVKKHGGEIWVQSVKDQGSTFYLTLPAAR